MTEQLYWIDEGHLATYTNATQYEFVRQIDSLRQYRILTTVVPSALVMWCFTHALAAVTHEPWRCPEYRPNDECEVGKAAVYRIEEDS